MTREEAKEILTHNWTRIDNPNYSESELDEAFFMAIEALQREEAEEKGYCHRIKPKEYFKNDAINRADAIEAVRHSKSYVIFKEALVVDKNEVMEKLSALPSANAIHSGGVFVPNMEMPKVCDYCLFHDSEWSWCKAKDKYCGDGKCPLIAVRDERREP